jgi:hypothetical protein
MKRFGYQTVSAKWKYFRMKKKLSLTSEVVFENGITIIFGR